MTKESKAETELRGLINDFKVFVYEHGNNQKMQEKLKKAMTALGTLVGDEEPVPSVPTEVEDEKPKSKNLQSK